MVLEGQFFFFFFFFFYKVVIRQTLFCLYVSGTELPGITMFTMCARYMY